MSSQDSKSALSKVKMITDYICRIQKFSKLIPEVRTNVAVAAPKAKSLNEIAGVDGRITVVQGMPKMAGSICFGATNHTGRLLLTAQIHDPTINCLINIRYSHELIQKIIQQGKLSLAEIDRKRQSKETSQIEDSSMSWIIKNIYGQHQKIPDIIWDIGEIGKEPMIRLFALSAEKLIEKIALILELVD